MFVLKLLILLVFIACGSAYASDEKLDAFHKSLSELKKSAPGFFDPTPFDIKSTNLKKCIRSKFDDAGRVYFGDGTNIGFEKKSVTISLDTSKLVDLDGSVDSIVVRPGVFSYLTNIKNPKNDTWYVLSMKQGLLLVTHIGAFKNHDTGWTCVDYGTFSIKPPPGEKL